VPRARVRAKQGFDVSKFGIHQFCFALLGLLGTGVALTQVSKR
jgi:hypothetical protein